MVKIFFLYFLLVLGCKEETSITNAVKEITYQSKDFDVYPTFLKHHDCEVSGKNFFYATWYNGELGQVERKKIYTKTQKRKFASTNSVKSIFVGSEVGISSPIIKKAGSKISLCSSFKDYPEETSESIATSVLPILDQSHRFIQKTLKKHLSKINILIQPTVRSLKQTTKNHNFVQHEYTYLTDNAFYTNINESPFYGSVIAFTPQSKHVVEKSLDPFTKVIYNGFPLWYFPFVTAHEYGHHVFNELINNSFSKEDFSSLPQSDEVTLREKKNRLVVFIEESFSDLFASYLLESKYLIFSDIPCFENLRNIESNYFLKKNKISKKVFSNQLLNSFLSSAKERTHEICEASATNPYTIASVSNYFINNLLDDLKLSKSQKFINVFQLYKKVIQNKQNLKLINEGKIKEFLIILYKSFLKKINESNKISKTKCYQVKTLLPAFYSYLIEKKKVSDQCLLKR